MWTSWSAPSPRSGRGSEPAPAVPARAPALSCPRPRPFLPARALSGPRARAGPSGSLSGVAHRMCAAPSSCPRCPGPPDRLAAIPVPTRSSCDDARGIPRFVAIVSPRVPDPTWGNAVGRGGSLARKRSFSARAGYSCVVCHPAAAAGIPTWVFAGLSGGFLATFAWVPAAAARNRHRIGRPRTLNMRRRPHRVDAGAGRRVRGRRRVDAGAELRGRRGPVGRRPGPRPTAPARSCR